MNWITWMFLAALSAETAARLWLASRQIDAVTAHRNRVPEAFQGRIALPDQQKAADYTLARVGLGRWATVVESLIKIGFTIGGGLAAVDALVRHLVRTEPWHGCLVILTVFLMLQLLGLPFTVWRTFRIEARFGFNRISPRLFAVDLGKRLLLGLVLGAPLAWITLWLMDRMGTWWWVWAWLVCVATMLIIAWAAPRFIAPLFNRFTAITDAALKERVEALLRRCGYEAGGGVFVMDGSRRSAHGNAYFTGIGRNKRIVFFDTLLARIDVAEIEAVLAHELGHFRLHHVRQRLLTSLLSALAALALLGWLARLPQFYGAFGVPENSAMALLLFALTAPAFIFFATPIEAWWSRRQELAADEFAAKHADAGNLATALVKLYRDNATTLTPDRVHSAFYDSHPPAVVRIARLQKLAAQ
ncbi:MAG TPA: M48 family metallopeptidase [Steroidobacteraceae bacterium]|nr:M48 family metallopeptidase [Steroidobacteraceae bacterium]